MTRLTETAQAAQCAALDRADRTGSTHVPVRRLLLLAPPLLLAALEIAHPQPDENAQALMDVATWFAGFHVIQLVLAGLVALSVFLLADSFGRASACADQPLHVAVRHARTVPSLGGCGSGRP
ncbi:MAG TPA: hypothetical protein VK490_05175 [Gaiellaceae bacterium]|nr:hypothetical protein [Gaiellaceae bacterium]